MTIISSITTIFKSLNLIIAVVLKKLNKPSKKVLCIEFIELCRHSSYNTSIDYTGFTDPRIIYSNNNADFSSYKSNGFNHNIINILNTSHIIPSTYIEMHKRSNSKLPNDIKNDIRVYYPDIFTKLQNEFTKGFCYKYEIQQCFDIKPTYKNPYKI